MYFWPPAPTGKGNMSITAVSPSSAVVDGVTLFSPTVYISLRTIFASNSCQQVGARHTGTLVAMQPEDVSTQVQLGGKVWDLHYDKLDYNDLVGPPPLDDYMDQGSCVFVACPTIYSKSYRPTLVAPSQVRSVDPAWASCALAIQGL